VFELCFKDQLLEYFQINNFLSTEQYGFLPKCSTVKAVVNLIEKILLNFENKNITSALLIDLKNAFGCIVPELLLEKFICFGIKGKELKLLASYFYDRKQFVAQGQDLSKIKEIILGILQGSGLAPLLFIIALNDIAANMPGESIAYVDDINIIDSDKDINVLLSKQDNSFDSAKRWFARNYLVVNNSKTESILFSLNNEILSKNESVKLLGIHLDPKLNWDNHVNHLCSKLSRVTFLLCKLKHCVNKKC